MRNICVLLLLTAAVAAVYYPALNYGFVNYDDPLYVTENPVVLAGVTPESVLRAFTDRSISLWTPLTLLSYQVEVELFGANPAVMHRTNVALHALNAMLLYALLIQLTAQFWPSLFVALLFAVHPTRVESVAWIAERKDVLCTVFWMLASISWVSFIRSRSPLLYLTALLLFVLGLLAKPMVLTLPAAWLVLDFWPLGRLRSRNDLVAAVGEKIPFFAVAAASIAVTFFAQAAGGALHERTLLERLSNVVGGYIAYVKMTFYPVDLAVYYPDPPGTPPIAVVTAAAALLLVLTAAAFALYRRAPFVTAGWAWYLGTLVPVIGFVKSGGQAFADRYTYIPTIGLLLIAVWSVYKLTERRTGLPLRAVAVAGFMAVAVLAGVANQQVRVWKDSEALFKHALASTTDNVLAHVKLGEFYESEHRTELAVEQFESALKISPENTFANTNLALILLEQGKLDEAIALFEAALVRPYKPVESRQRLAAAYYAAQNYADAERVYRMQIEDPHIERDDLDNSYFWLLRTLELAGKQHELEKVLVEYTTRLPDSPRAAFESGRAAERNGDLDAARQHYERAVQLDDTFAPAWIHLGVLYGRIGQLDRAIRAFRTAIRHDEDSAAAHKNLATALRFAGQTAEAARHEQRAAELLKQPQSLIAQ